ncbi:MAG: glycosyltransferase [Peptococcaceae bacterium]|jgi:glycosyltransferase involved in cell wall biosynthesis|nr:glycosyltransferase [Peptococcaceae bacterium]
MLLCLACIVKDEEDMIAGLLTSVRGLVDEAVVVDTGSADNTVGVAEGLGARVIRSTWRGSFAEARNESLDQCRGDWIIFLDADERVTATGFKAVRRQLASAREDGFYVTLVNYADLAMTTPVEDIKVFRVFRRRPEYRFSGTIHEQVLPEVMARGKGIGLLPLTVAHLGYVPAVIRERNKQARNLAMCEEAYRAAFQSPLARLYALFNLAREYQNTGDFARGVELYGELLKNREIENEAYYPIAAYNICNCLAQLPGREETALSLADSCLSLLPDYPELWYLRGTFLSRLQRSDEALESFIKSLAQKTDNPRYISRMPRLREMTWVAVAGIKKQKQDVAGYLAALHKAWEENPTVANLNLLLEITRLLLSHEKPADIVHNYLATAPGIQTDLWLPVRQLFLVSRAYTGARDISGCFLKPRNRSVFQFLRSIDDNICIDGPVDLGVFLAKGQVMSDPLLSPVDRELAALLFLTGPPTELPWPALAVRADGGNEAGRAVMELAAYFSGEGPRDNVRTVKAIYTLMVKYRRLPNAWLTARLKDVLVGLGEAAVMVTENLKRIEALE